MDHVKTVIQGQVMSRYEKSHQSSVRGFEVEKDLSTMAVNDQFDGIVCDIDLATSTWYDSIMAPHGRQRAVDELMLGNDLIKGSM